MTRRGRRWVGLCAALVALAAPAAAQAAPVAGLTDDPREDVAEPSRDLVGAGARLDGAGELRVTAAVAEPPAADGLLLVVLGRQDSGGACVPVLAVGGQTASGGPGEWGSFAGTAYTREGDATVTLDGSTVTVVARDGRLADPGVDCARTRLDSSAGSTAPDDTRTFALAADAAPPPPPPPPPTTTATTPAPTPTATTPAPAPTPATTPAAPTPTPTPAPAPAPTQTTPTSTPTQAATVPAPVPRRSGAHLELRLPTVRPGRRGVTRTLTLRVANRGTRTAARPVLRLTPPRGVTVRPRRQTLASMRRGTSRTVRLRVRVTSRAKATSTIGISVRTRSRGTARSATARLALPVRRPSGTTPSTTPSTPGTPATPGSPGTPAAPANPLVGRYFIFFQVDPIVGQRLDAVLLLDGTWAYRGVPEGGPPTCTARAVDEDGEGCVPWTYDAATRAITVDGKPGTVSADATELELDERSFGYFPLVAAQSKLNATLSSVRCFGILPNQTCSASDLVLRPDGTFARGGGVTSTTPDSTTTAIPADSSGTYAIAVDGRITFTYGDGRVVNETIAVPRDGKTGSTDPATEGLLLDDSFFTAR